MESVWHSSIVTCRCRWPVLTTSRLKLQEGAILWSRRHTHTMMRETTNREETDSCSREEVWQREPNLLPTGGQKIHANMIHLFIIWPIIIKTHRVIKFWKGTIILQLWHRSNNGWIERMNHVDRNFMPPINRRFSSMTKRRKNQLIVGSNTKEWNNYYPFDENIDWRLISYFSLFIRLKKIVYNY